MDPTSLRRTAAVIGAVALIAACGLPVIAQPATGRLKVLRVEQPSEVFSVDPAIIENPWSIQPVENLWDSLVQLDADNHIVPAAAREWTVSPDGLTWTFKLHRDARWSNGERVTARDFKYALNRIAWPETKAPYVFLLKGVAGAKDVISGASRDIAGIRAPDDDTLQITLIEPEAYFLAMAATWVFSPMNQGALEQGGEQWATPGKLINNGAFLLKAWDRPTRMVLVANPAYYAGRPKIDEIDINIVKDPQAALLKYENGELDVVDVPDADIQRIKSHSTLSTEMHRRPLMRVRWIAFNVSKPPFNNQKLREAVAYAVDRKRLVDLAFSNTFEPACQEIPPGLIAARPGFCWPGPDPAKARQLMAEAGYPAGTVPPAVKFATRSIPSDVRAVEVVTSQIKAALGWEIPIEPMTPQNYSAWRKNGQPNKTVLVGTWGLDYFDPQDWLDPLFTTKAPFNYGDVADPYFDGLVKKANGLRNGHERMRLYAQAERILLDKMYVVPLWVEVANWLAKPYVHGFQYSLAYWPSLKNVTLY